ncbi:MAG: HD domain-containing protein [Treponema sp.]|nr:HD domain-containing protein [Treponema sp.]
MNNDLDSILIDLGLDEDAAAAARIICRQPPHDPPEEGVGAQLGPGVERLVNGAAHIERLPLNNKTIREAQNIRNMIFALTDDIRVIIIKLAEKLYVLRGRETSDGEIRKKTARECLDIYAPLADRLGIAWLKDEMEDLSLKYLNREAYQQIKDMVSATRERRSEFLDRVQKTIAIEMEAAGISADVHSRAKHFYSVYMKMRKRGKSAAEIYDLSGIRIICDSVENCYTLLGIVHRLWKPCGVFRDYIARPKPNGYQSLHTSVTADDGGIERLLEVQIRTREMHEIAENGVASHWLYKKGSSRDMVRPQDIDVVNRMKWWKQNEQDGSSWLEEIKKEILNNFIYVFTPQGKVIKLPAGATPIDFAYHIHSAVGGHCIGAKANGSIIPLSSELKNTQVVEILTSPSAHPHLNWLQTTKSHRARSKIKSWLEQNDESLSREKAEKKKPPAEAAPAAPAAAESVPANESYVQRVTRPLSSALQVRVDDEKNLMVRFARCCNPLPGDSITGYVSRGRGIIIHRKNCTNLENIPEFDERKIEAEWENSESSMVRHFRIDAKHTANLFSEIEGAIRRRQGHLIEGRLEETAASKKAGANRLTGYFTIQLVDADDLKPVMKNIRSIPGILGIQLV